jgi:hypothetical protein
MENSFRFCPKPFFLIISLLSFSLTSFSQVSSYDWAEMISSTLLDESYSIATDDAGNSYVTGIFNGSADIGDITLIARGATDIFLAKYDPSGVLLWVRQAGGKEDDDSYAVHVSQDGYCYLTGSFADTAYFEEEKLICFDDNIYYFDIFLAKYTLDGDLVWVTRAGEQYWDEAFGVCTNTSGEIFITGSYWGTAKFDHITLTGLYGLGATDGFDIFIAKYDADGNALWAKRMVEQGWDRGSDVASDPNGNCYVTGGFQAALLFGGFGGPSLTATGGSGDEDIFMAKYDPIGNFVWKTSAGGIGFDQARAVFVDDDNYIYLTGVFNDTATFDSTQSVISNGSHDVFLAKYDSTGQIVWVRGAGSEGEDGADDVITDSQGNIYLCGYIGGIAQFGDLQIVGAGLFIAKYDSEGRALWVKQIGEPDNLGKSLALTPTGDLVLTGVFENTATFGSHVLNGNGQTDIFVTKLDTVTLTAIEDRSSSNPHIFYLAQNYPNPFNPKTIINYELPFTTDIDISIYNLLGQKVASLVQEKQSVGKYQVEWNATGFASGVYYYQLRGKTGVIQTKKMLLLR